jgi:hypothetical protein
VCLNAHKHLGHAHTDIKVVNIFVDNVTAFLEDLGFVASTTAPARPEGRSLAEAAGQTAQEQDLEFVVSTTAPAGPEGRGLAEAAGQNAQEQDLAQLELLSGNILRL